MQVEDKKPVGRPKDQGLTDRRREEILESAEKTFAEHGYQRTDVQWIADALSISKGTIYRYFPSKETLFLSTVERGVQRMWEFSQNAKQGIEDPIALIRAGVVAYLQFFKQNPQVVELFIQERAEFKSRGKAIYFEHRDVRRGPWRDLVAQLIAEGTFREMPAERVIDVVGDILYGTMFTNHFAGRDKPFETQAADILDILFHGFLSEQKRAELNAAMPSKQ